MGYRKRKGVSKLVTGKEYGGPKSGYRKRKGASNMVTEEKEGPKYGYGNKLGSQIWLRKQIGVPKMVMEKSIPVTFFETPIYFLTQI